MELRKTEETMDEMLGLYESLRQSPIWLELGHALPEYPKTSLLQPGESAMPPLTFIANLATAVDVLHRIQSTLPTLPIEKFRKRLNEKDPITHQPRYGEKTQQRVQALMDLYDFLMEHIPTTDKDPKEHGTHTLLTELQRRHEQQLSQEQQLLQEQELERQRQEELVRQETLRLQREEEQQAQEAAERHRQQQQAAEAELRRQAEEIRQRRLAQERAEREWIESIPKGIDGVQLQLSIIKEATKDDMEAQRTAISSLYTIFQQINAHPEETKFRRIRRDHEKFVQDIGRHAGGVEFLIAAGFELGAIDDVPCYLSKEPNIETDMDGWAAWFDLLKGTLDVLEQEMSKLPKRP